VLGHFLPTPPHLLPPTPQPSGLCALPRLDCPCQVNRNLCTPQVLLQKTLPSLLTQPEGDCEGTSTYPLETRCMPHWNKLNTAVHMPRDEGCINTTPTDHTALQLLSPSCAPVYSIVSRCCSVDPQIAPCNTTYERVLIMPTPRSSHRSLSKAAAAAVGTEKHCSKHLSTNCSRPAGHCMCCLCSRCAAFCHAILAGRSCSYTSQYVH